VNSETWRTKEASLRIPPPRPFLKSLDRQLTLMGAIKGKASSSPLFGFAKSLFFIGFLEDKEGLLLYALIGDEAFAVEVVLEAGVDAAG